jgi:hypothetical protein
MQSINIRDARNLLGDLVKGAPSGHHLSQFPVAPIKQGAEGWNGGRVWPVFEAIRPLAGQSSKEATVEFVRNLLAKSNATEVLASLSEVDWPGLLPSGGAAPALSPAPDLPAPELEGHRHPDEPPANDAGAPAGSSAAMRAMLDGLVKGTEAAEKAEQAQATELAELRRDMKALAKEVGKEIGGIGKSVEVMVTKAAEEQGGNVTVATVRGVVAEVMRDLAPSKAEVAEIAEGARELPAIPEMRPDYVKPDWHDEVADFISGDLNGAIGGSSGAGKTYPLKMICADLGRPCKVIAANENLDAETLVSMPNVKGGDSYYTDGPLVHAMRHGYVLIMDEGDELRRGEALVINDAIESRKITIPQTGEVVHAKAGFCIWFTSNSLGDELGLFNREGFDESLLQRLLQLIAKPLSLKEEVSILTKLEAPDGTKLSRGEATDLAKWAHAARPLHFGINGNEPVLTSCPSTRVLVQAAEVWLGFNRETGQTFRPARKRLTDIRQALWYPYAAARSTEEVAALKSCDLWVWG